MMKKLIFTALSCMTGSWTRNLSLGFIALILAMSTHAVMATSTTNTVEIEDDFPTNEKCGKMILRVAVRDHNNELIAGLKKDDFSIVSVDKNSPSKTQKFDVDDLTFADSSSKPGPPEPVYLVLLLDMSGSMRYQDMAGTQKLEGAVSAIKLFIDKINDKINNEKMDIKLTIIPFGEPGDFEKRGDGLCPGYDTSERMIQDKINNDFMSFKPQQLKDNLDQIKNGAKLCESTRIYEPLSEVVKQLGTLNLAQFQPQVSSPSSETSQKSLSARKDVILFSDGYDSVSQDVQEDQARYQKLLETLKDYPDVTVHTMGYGYKLPELVKKVNCNLSLNNQALQVTNLYAVHEVIKSCQLPEKGDIKPWIVDEPKLNDIAKQTKGGIHRMPANVQDVIDSFQAIMSTLKKYELHYTISGAEKGDTYETRVIVNSPSQNVHLTSDPRPISMQNFNFCPPSNDNLVKLIGFAVVGAIALIIAFFVFTILS